MNNTNIHAVTGAFGYSGRYIAKRLLDAGKEVITLTNSTNKPNPFQDKVKQFPLDFTDTNDITTSLHNVEVLYNTYWVRFNYKGFRQSVAVENTIKLIDAARNAGVKKIVHISITNPSIDSKYEYFKDKAILEQKITESGLSYSILRPAVIFGSEDILINNIAWVIRKFPFVAIFGDGQYKLQPIFVDDLAELAVSHGSKPENIILDAIGPETFTYRELVQTVMESIGIKKHLISIPPVIGFLSGKIIGWLKNDIVMTWQELGGLMDNLLFTESLPTGKTKLSLWLKENSNVVGTQYANELVRRK
ncbi:MAG: hypothetical protein HW421_3646 [Ignavibacteria bacterium]|nr:hypothetical protein [Ignavibacteria bacterium]